MKSTFRLPALILPTVMFAGLAVTFNADKWTADEIEELRGMWIGSLEKLPADPTNRVADDPRAVGLGHRLFFESRLSSNGKVSCSRCHKPERDFQDDTPLASGVGTTGRRTMPIAATARAPFLFWDGRKDSQWAQALGPLESAVEHGGNRAQYAHLIAKSYREEYEALFGALPDLSRVPLSAGPVSDSAANAAWKGMTAQQRTQVTRIFVNIGKVIAASERRLEAGTTRFDRYVEGLVQYGSAPTGVLTSDEVAGLRLFIGKANCTQCHNGPLLTNNEFHNTGIPAAANLPADLGRIAGARAVIADEFNCRSQWSDATSDCNELEFITTGEHEQERAFKVPSLRNVAERAPYMHAGQIPTLAAALNHYNRAPSAPAGHTELKPLRLNAKELAQLEAYLRSLGGGTRAPAPLLTAPPK